MNSKPADFETFKTRINELETCICQKINQLSLEADLGNTPDFILAEVAMRSLLAFSDCTNKRDYIKNEGAKCGAN